MKTRILSFMASAVAVVALLTGCSTENDFENGKDGFGYLELSSVNSADMLTRAAIDGTNFPQTGEIGLFLFKDETATQDYGEGYKNIKYSYNSSKRKWTATPSIKVGSTPGYLYGYYPYKESNTNIKAIPVSSSVNGDDVMYASKQAEPITDATAANTSITMNHALARVAITVINKGYTGNAELSQIKFEGAKLAGSGTLDATSGSITATKADDVTLSVPEAAQTIATGEGTTYECLLVPSGEDESKQTITLTFTIDGNNKTAILSGNDNGVIIAQGTKSNITITLSNTGIAVQTVSVEDWNVVEVGGHKVTMKFADELTPHDVLTEIYAEGNTAKIVAISLSRERLWCTITGTAEVSRSKSDNVYTFTVSSISENTTATIGYEKPLSVTVSSNNTAWGTAKYEGSPYIGEKVTFTATAKEGCSFIKWQDADGNDLGWTNPKTITLSSDITAIAVFAPKDALSGVFTVSDDGNGNVKKVRFSKGNLYYDGTQSKYFFESNQYAVPPRTSNNETESHVGHFYWSKSAAVAISLSNYSVPYQPSNEDVFFTNDSENQEKPNLEFTVNGQTGFWRVLSGGINGEWKYLVNKDNECGTTVRSGKYKYGVTVCGQNDCLILLPDDWDETVISLGDFATTTKYDEGTTVKWSTMQAAGAVCLPAAGYRNGGPGSQSPATVNFVGSNGYYWSVSPNLDNKAYDLSFNSDNVNPNSNDTRDRAQSVRLVTDVK